MIKKTTGKTPRILVASRYLKNSLGHMDGIAKDKNIDYDGKHVKITTNSFEDGKFSLYGENSGLLRKDLANAIVLSALSGDHDVNPGNIMGVFDKDLDKMRIARIDFGHAFNDLLNHSSMFGGKVKNKENGILDFFNRETVSHFKPNNRTTKLWKNYEGLIPSQELADSLKEIGNSKNVQKGLENVKDNILELINDLSNDPQKNQKAINHITTSLIGISNGENVSSQAINEKLPPKEIINKVFENLSNFYERNQKQMRDVAKLMQTQVDIDKVIKDRKAGKEPDFELINKVKSQYEDLKLAKGIENEKGEINWVKRDKDIKAFTGNLEKYVKIRSIELEFHGKFVDIMQPAAKDSFLHPDLHNKIKGIRKGIEHHLKNKDSKTDSLGSDDSDVIRIRGTAVTKKDAPKGHKR